MMRPPREDTQPWYKQFWPWFLISLPLSVVIASLYTINLAIKTDDGLVSDDYYKEGLGIHKDAASSAKALALGIAVELSYDKDTGAVGVQLAKPLQPKPGILTLQVTHPTRPNQDQSVPLVPVDERRFSGRVEPLNDANWQLEIHPDDTSWRIQGRLNTATQSTTRLD